MEVLDGVLAYRLLKSVNLTKQQKQLVKATVSNMDYQIMKDQLKKVFTSSSGYVDNKADIDKIDVKSEENEAFYTSKNNNYRNIIVLDDLSVEITKILKMKITKKINPFNNKGEISRYNFCGSKFHWEKNCPDATKKILVMIYDYMNN